MRITDFKPLIQAMPVAYHAESAKLSTWEKLPAVDETLLNHLHSKFPKGDNEICLSRADLRSLAKEDDLRPFVMATIIWGYPSGMRGNNFLHIIEKIDNLVELLSSAKREGITDWMAHWEKIKAIKGLGLSTYSKFLQFLDVKVEQRKALILDDRISRVATSGNFQDFTMAGLKYENAPEKYSEYLNRIHEIANWHNLEAEKIEYFLFQFGLNLKII